MKASETHLLKFLKKSEQFAVPIYQRTYSWTESECRQLWDDVIRTGSNDDIRAHFLGSIVYIEKGLYSVTGYSPMLVIDGQQRLTTVSLIIEALARHLEGSGEPIDGFSTNKLRNYYLLNPEETGERRYKLILSKTDKETYLSLADQGQPPNESSYRVTKNFELFQKYIERSKDLQPLCQGLEKLAIVDISLNREHDNPQLIFESMNSTGKELSQSDLIRNFVLMDQELDEQHYLYNYFWYPMETSFGQESYVEDFDYFMRHYLTVKTGSTPPVRKVYEEFKDFRRNSKQDISDILQDVYKFSQYYCALTLDKEQDPQLAEVFFDIHQLRAAVVYPLLLEMYDDYENNILTYKEFLTATKLVESYVLRQAICDIPPNSMNKTIESFAKRIDKDNYLESFQAEFLLLQGNRRFPDDQEFQNQIIKKNIYHFRRRDYLFRKLENFGRKEPVSVNEYTIEHIMPQNENLSPVWQKALGEDWERIHSELLHTLGNLTLTGYNSEYSDRPFPEKRDIEGGFRQSPLFLNRSLGSTEVWNEEAILDRADILSNQALEVWTSPALPNEILDRYRPAVKERTRRILPKYAIEDHEHLRRGAAMHALFLELSREIQAIDPGVLEDFRKPYVSYKFEGTGFVNVCGISQDIHIGILMPFAELYDPNKVAAYVPRSKGWGRTGAELLIRNPEEIPYLMGLIRQSFNYLAENGR